MPLNHIAFIMDGNGRWATARSLPRTKGYAAGLNALKRVIAQCAKRDVKVVSVYAFSTENNGRPDNEKLAIFDTVKNFNNSYDGEMKILYMGEIDGLPKDVADSVRYVEDKTADNKGLILNIALNYGGKDDIIHACKLAWDHNDFTVEGFESGLASCGLPALDAVVRTGGEKRLSNFMLYECAYSELFFIDKLWPDMNEDDVDAIIDEFEGRTRKFGK